MTTNSKYLIDSFAWIEYAEGSTQGRIVRQILMNPKNKIFTLESTLAEIKEWAIRRQKDFNRLHASIRANTLISPLFIDDWLRAAELKFEMREKIKDFGLIDALLLAYQEKYTITIVTGDPHFKGMKNVRYTG